jgi:DNA repair protein RecO (recombination protein O)
MPTRSAEAIVLRQYSLGEADRIVVFFSREYGKIRAVAKGAKKPRSRFGGCLEPLNQIQIEFFAREGADLSRVTRCEMVHSYLGSNPEPENMVLLSYLAEIVNEIVQENNPNALLYRLFLATLKAGEPKGMNESLVRYFEFWSLRLSGLLPNYDYCSNCSRCVKDVGFYAWLEAGQARCEECAGGKGIRIRPVASKALQAIWELSPADFAAKPLTAPASADLERLSRRLLEWHLEKQLKSLPAVRAVFSDRQNR